MGCGASSKPGEDKPAEALSDKIATAPEPKKEKPVAEKPADRLIKLEPKKDDLTWAAALKTQKTLASEHERAKSALKAASKAEELTRAHVLKQVCLGFEDLAASLKELCAVEAARKSSLEQFISEVNQQKLAANEVEDLLQAKSFKEFEQKASDMLEELLRDMPAESNNPNESNNPDESNNTHPQEGNGQEGRRLLFKAIQWKAARERRAWVADVVAKEWLDVIYQEAVTAILKKRAATDILQLVALMRDEHTAVHREQAAGALRNYAYNFRVAIREAGGIAPLVALVRDGSTAKQKEHAAGALRNVAVNCIENQVEIREAGGIAPLVALLKDGSMAGQKEESAGALGNLAYNCSDNMVAIREEGGIAPLVALVRDGSMVAQKEQATCALRNLTTADGPENGVAIREAGGIAPFVAIVDRYSIRPGTSPEREKSMQQLEIEHASWSTPKQIEHAAAALRNLAADSTENKVAIREARGIAPLVAFLPFPMNRHLLGHSLPSFHDRVIPAEQKEQAAGALGNLMYNCPENRVAYRVLFGDRMYAPDVMILHDTLSKDSTSSLNKTVRAAIQNLEVDRLGYDDVEVSKKPTGNEPAGVQKSTGHCAPS